MVNRRKMLAIGGGAGAALLVSYGWRSTLVAETAPPLTHDHTTSLTASSSPSFTAFAAQMPVMPELAPVLRTRTTDYYRLPVTNRTLEILPGFQTPVLTFGGSIPGPTIRARTGRQVRIAVENQSQGSTNVHMHGAYVSPEHDGHPLDTIESGAVRMYEYPNTQQGATLWYHDHSHHTEAERVYRGLHGTYIIDDPAERTLGLPSGEYDVPITLRDALFDQGGNMLWGGNPAERDVILANGKPVPYFPVAARKYRLRLVNAATERMFHLDLGGEEMIQIASDGGLLPAPVSRTQLTIGSAERAEIVVDFSKYPVGTKLVLNDVLGPVMRFDITRTATDRSRVPSTLRDLPITPAATVTRNIEMSFDMSGAMPLGLMDGKPFDPARVDMQIRRGDTEIWNIHNADLQLGGIKHTFHMHLVQFEVISRGGLPPTADDKGRKDTVYVHPGETVQVKAHFDTEYLGKYLYHCHFLEHSSLGMMAQMEIVP